MIDGDIKKGNGICILNGASAINCHVQKFGIGIYVENGGEVNDCEVMVMFNDRQGISIANEASSTSKMKISNTYVHDNGVRIYSSGIYFVGSGASPESSETSIEINNVKSNRNGGDGMRFYGGNVKLEVQVKDSETSNNGFDGITFTYAAADLEFDGIISRYNGNRGLTVSSFNAEGNVKVKGDVNLYKNRFEGIRASGDVDIVVERRGALNSCGHIGTYNADILANGADITFSGNGYTCDSTSPNLSDIITCDPCPNCPQ